VAGSSWGLDLASNTVLVSVPAGRGAAFVTRTRSFGAAVTVERAPAVRTHAFYGGQAILRNGSRCSAGFITVLDGGAFRDITGASRVVVGSSACKTGSTTGTTCGTVQAYNVTVRYAQGTVYGLTRTNICTQPGDSGGTIGGCGQGFQSLFQPADEALSVDGLTLL
jgi:hypothetical protein